jgi:hypothetical protein
MGLQTSFLSAYYQAGSRNSCAVLSMPRERAGAHVSTLYEPAGIYTAPSTSSFATDSIFNRCGTQTIASLPELPRLAEHVAFRSEAFSRGLGETGATDPQGRQLTLRDAALALSTGNAATPGNGHTPTLIAPLRRLQAALCPEHPPALSGARACIDSPPPWRPVHQHPRQRDLVGADSNWRTG